MSGLKKNIAGQKWVVFAFDITNNQPRTGDAANITAKIVKDYGAATALTDTNPTEIEDGYYVFDLTQSETNADSLLILPESVSASVKVLGSPATIFTAPDGFSDGTITNLTNLPTIPTDWISAAGLAADAVTEIQSGLMLAASYTAPPSAADIWTYATRVLTAGTNIGTVAANITQVQGQTTYADALTYLLTTGYVGVDGDIRVQATGNWSTFNAATDYVLADIRKWNNSTDGIGQYARVLKLMSTWYSATAAGQTVTNFRADESGNLELRVGQSVLVDQISTDSRYICTVVSVTAVGNDNDIELYPALLAACTTGDNLYKLPSASPDASVNALPTSSLDAAGVRSAVGLASANLDTQLADIPTIAEFEARTLIAANYFDPAADTVAHVTLVDTLTTYTSNTPQTGDAYAVVNSGTYGNAALKTLIDAIDAVVDAILADTGTDGVAIAASICNKIADHVRRRTQANVEASSDGDTLSVGSLYGAIQQSQESAISGTTQTIYKTDGATSLGTKTVSKTPDDDPIRGIS